MTCMSEGLDALDFYFFGRCRSFRVFFPLSLCMENIADVVRSFLPGGGFSTL